MTKTFAVVWCPSRASSRTLSDPRGASYTAWYSQRQRMGRSPRVAWNRRVDETRRIPSLEVHVFGKNDEPTGSSREGREEDSGGLGKLLKRVQGALPVVGLVSRLTSAEGGVGNDSTAYPEYCRQVYEAAPVGFQEAIGDLQNKYGKSAQRRYVLLCLWMIMQGSGVVPKTLIVDSARRVRVSQDVEFEMERFLGEYKQGMDKYEYIKDRQTAPLQEQADLAVDAMARLILPIQDGEEIDDTDAPMIEDVIVGGCLGYPDAFRECVRVSIATRSSREGLYGRT